MPGIASTLSQDIAGNPMLSETDTYTVFKALEKQIPSPMKHGLLDICRIKTTKGMYIHELGE